MNFKEMYRDVLGSAGLSIPVLYRVLKAASFPRVYRILNNFVINGRIVNAYGRQKHNDKFIPKSIVIEPTFRCNLECPDCYAPIDERLMTAELFESIIAQSKKLNIYRFELMGGEPTLPEVIDNVLPAIRKHKNCIFTFCTNCTQIDQAFADRMKEVNNVVIILSMEGTKEATEKRRGKGSYEKYLESVQTLKKNKMAFAMSITLEPALWKTQIDEKIIGDYVKAGGTVIYSYPRFDSEKKLFSNLPKIEYLKHIQRLCKKYPVYWGDGHFGKMKSHKGIIPRHDNQICIDPEGNVRPYRFYYDKVFGNLKDKSVEEILADPRLIKFKKEARKKANSRLAAEKDALAKQGFKVFDYSWGE